MILTTNIFVLLLLPNIYCLNGKQFLEYSAKQYSRVVNTLKTGSDYPYKGKPINNLWESTPGVKNQWTAGFYPGVLWQLCNHTKDEKWRQLAIKATDGVYDDQFNTGQHDIGFMIMCSYGDGYTFTKNISYPKIIVNAANHLAKRFNPKVGCTRSWDSGHNGQFLVIADNMMNLELLFEGWKMSGNKTLYDMAVSHTNRTIKEHIRQDFSHFHVVSFNETNGKVIRKFTASGYADWSCWAQSQAWLVAGLTIAYRYTKESYILKNAEGVANYFIDKSPSDGIPFWDFDVPTGHGYTPRDTSAASIAASGLIELFGFTKNMKYLNASNKIIETLFSDKYRADGKQEYKIPALIVNSTLEYHKNEYDLSLIYADYYLLKSLSHLL